MPMTLEEIQAYAPGITQDQLDEYLEQRRIAKGPPFRMTMEYPPPVLTPEEEAEALAQAEYDDDMGNFGADDGTYTVLRAQTQEDAIAEAKARWGDRNDPNAIGYAVWRNDWGCVHSYYIRKDGLKIG
jgi:hypothetical protein